MTVPAKQATGTPIKLLVSTMRDASVTLSFVSPSCALTITRETLGHHCTSISP